LCGGEIELVEKGRERVKYKKKLEQICHKTQEEGGIENET